MKLGRVQMASGELQWRLQRIDAKRHHLGDDTTRQLWKELMQLGLTKLPVNPYAVLTVPGGDRPAIFSQCRLPATQRAVQSLRRNT